MANTHCKSCMFSKETNSDNPCDFGLIEIIKDHKEISVVDNFFYIKDYKCNYGFSEHIYTTNPELQKEIDIKNFILDKAKLQYYLVLDIRLLSLEEIKNEISIIKKLDIKPKFISFISSNEQKTSDIIKTIKSLKAVAYQFATETFQAIETIILDFKNATNFTGVVIFRTASKKIIMVIRILFIEVIHILFMKFNRIFY